MAKSETKLTHRDDELVLIGWTDEQTIWRATEEEQQEDLRRRREDDSRGDKTMKRLTIKKVRQAQPGISMRTGALSSSVHRTPALYGVFVDGILVGHIEGHGKSGGWSIRRLSDDKLIGYADNLTLAKFKAARKFVG